MHRARAGSSVDRALPSGGRSRGFESLPARLAPCHAARHRLRHASPARAPRAARGVPRAPRGRRRDPARRRPDRALRARAAAVARPARARDPRQRRLGRAAGAAAARAHGRRRRRADRDDPRRRARRRPPGADAPPLPRGRRGRLRPLAHAAARGARRLRDLQPGLADRAPPRAPPHDGARDGPRTARRALRARDAGAAPRIRRPWTSRSSSPAPRAPCPPRGAGCPRSCCARAASGSCSTAARAPSSSCCARPGCPSSTRSSSPTTTSTTGSAWSGCSRRSTCARASGR